MAMTAWHSEQINKAAAPPRFVADPIEAQLIGSDTCKVRSITTKSSSPVLAMCRALIGAGYDPRRPLHCYRGSMLALKVGTVGEGAKLGKLMRPWPVVGLSSELAAPL